MTISKPRDLEVSGGPRDLMWLYALVYSAFVIYGSLVPLDFRALPLDDAMARFSQIQLLKLGVGSRADWVANLILYVPLGYLILGALAGRSKMPVVWILGIIITGFLVAGMALSIEFTQLFFPQRTVSLNDLYAEWVGGAVGMLLWPLTPGSLSEVWHRLARGGNQAIRASLVAYALVYLFLSLFPYDFLLNSTEWHTHLTSEKTGWLFAGNCGVLCWAKLLPEMLAVIPFGLLLATQSRGISILAAAIAGASLGLVIEILQLSIASGISQGASVFSRAAGVALGVWMPTLFRYWNSKRMQPGLRLGLIIAVVPYVAILMWLNHWFDASWVNVESALDRLPDISFIPFYYHYYTSEAVALVSLVFQFGLYLPLGAGIWLWYLGSPARGVGPWFSATLGLLIAAVIEIGKLFVPGQHSDPTNLLIAAVAAGGCHALLLSLFSNVQPTGPSPVVIRESVAGPIKQTPIVQENIKTSAPAWMVVASLLLAATLSLIGYPLGWLPWLFFLLLVLSAVCWRLPGSWLIIVPASLPLLDFSYLSGRLFWSEFDTLLLVVLAIAYARARSTPGMSWPGRLPMLVYVTSSLISLVIGLLPLAPLDLNAFTHYTSPYNALHALKGLAFALAFLPLIKSEWSLDKQRFTSRLAFGMSIGLVLELFYVIWERATFSGLWNFATDYRITGSFPGMHIGGASIEAYLVLAAPFVWLWAWPRRRAWAMLVAGGLYGVAAYGVMVTFSRGGQAAFIIETLLMLMGLSLLKWKTSRQGISTVLILVVSVVVAGLIAWPIISGKFSQARLATIQSDLDTRIAHWKDALDIMSQAGNPVFGVGAGTFPAAFYWYSSVLTRPSAYAFSEQGGDVFLRLGGGESLYFEQVVPIVPGQTYRLILDARSSAKSAALTVPVCEKALLYSFTCAWNTIRLKSTPGKWQRWEVHIKTDNFGPPGSLLKRPVKLSMFNQNKANVIDVDNVKLLDRQGNNLVRNGDFSNGMQFWFFSTDSHLAWHAKNLFVHVLFEQGWLGLIAFLLVLSVAGISLFRRSGHDVMALTMLVSFAAFLIVGLVDSLIDEPRLDFLFFWLLIIALISSSRGLHGDRPVVMVQNNR